SPTRRPPFRSSASASPGWRWARSPSSAAARGRASRSPVPARSTETTMSFLELPGVQKHFGPTVAVEDFNLAAERGEFVSFLGPSGCGKTTTLRMIAGFEQPTAGSLVVGGQEITHR